MGKATIRRYEEAKAGFGPLSPSLCASILVIPLLFCPAFLFMAFPVWESEEGCPTACRLGRVKALLSEGGSWWGPGWLLELGTEVVVEQHMLESVCVHGQITFLDTGSCTQGAPPGIWDLASKEED